jgi:hypothetical protein
MLLTISLLLLASTPEAATPPPATQEVIALIWGGGKDAASAEDSLRRWEEEKKLLGDALTLAEGFPKRVSSASVPGLNPGFEIVLIGYCGRDEATNARRFLKGLYPFAYEKPVKVEAAACPRWAGEKQDVVVEPPKTVKGKGVTLTVAVASLKGPVEPDIGVEVTTKWVRVVARDSKNKLLDVVSVEDTETGTGMSTVGCGTEEVTVRKSAVVLERTCTTPAGAACNRNPGKRTRSTVRWDGDLERLDTDEKTLEEWTVDYNKDCAE